MFNNPHKFIHFIAAKWHTINSLWEFHTTFILGIAQLSLTLVRPKAYGKFFFSSNTLAVRTPKIILKLLLKTFSFSSNQGYRNFEIQIGPLDRWRRRRHTNMSATIINSHENSSFSSKSVSEIDYFSNTVQLQPVVSKRSRDNPKSLA